MPALHAALSPPCIIGVRNGSGISAAAARPHRVCCPPLQGGLGSFRPPPIWPAVHPACVSYSPCAAEQLVRKEWEMEPGMGLYCDLCERLCRT